MKFELELGPCPAEEDAVQLSNVEDRSELMKRQCRAWREQLERTLQKSREHRDSALKLRVKNMDHDFGTYYEVIATCDDADELAVAAAFWLQENAPLTFDSDIAARL